MFNVIIRSLILVAIIGILMYIIVTVALQSPISAVLIIFAIFILYEGNSKEIN